MKHGIILPAIFNPIQHVAGSNYRSSVDMDTHIRVDASIGTGGTGGSNHCTAVNHQPSVGVDAVTFTGFTGHLDGQVTTVDSSYGNTVLVGVDAVVAGCNMNIAAVDS